MPNGTWCAARTRPHCEASVVTQLSAQGFSALWCHFLRRGRHARKETETRVAVFPCYVFVFVPTEGIWGPILRTPGVLELVRKGGCRSRQAQLATLPAGAVDVLQAHQNSGWPELCSHHGRGVRPGADVEVISGPFVHLIGKVLAMRPQERALVLLNLFGGQTEAVLSAGDLAPV